MAAAEGGIASKLITCYFGEGEWREGEISQRGGQGAGPSAVRYLRRVSSGGLTRAASPTPSIRQPERSDLAVRSTTRQRRRCALLPLDSATPLPPRRTPTR